MSTHALIAYQKRVDDQLTWVYLHHDGYPEHAWEHLKEYYNSYEKAKELVSMGGMSSLDKTITTSKFYYRDRAGFQPYDQPESPEISDGSMTDLILAAKECFAHSLYIWQTIGNYWLHIDVSKL